MSWAYNYICELATSTEYLLMGSIFLSLQLRCVFGPVPIKTNVTSYVDKPFYACILALIQGIRGLLKARPSVLKADAFF